MSRMRLLAYLVYVYSVNGAYQLIPGCFLVPRRPFYRLVRLPQGELGSDVETGALGE